MIKTLTRATALAAGLGTAALVAAAAPAGAVTSPVPHAGPTSQVASVTFANRHDNGHGTPSEWLLYGSQTLPSGVVRGNLASTITITKTGPTTYAVTMTASGSGQTVQGAGSPNATLPGNLDCFPFTVSLASGSGLTETIHATAGPTVPLQGHVYFGDAQSFSGVPSLAFPSGTVTSVSVDSYDFGYHPVPNAVNSGQAAPFTWSDTSDNGDGNAPGDGQISCAL